MLVIGRMKKFLPFLVMVFTAACSFFDSYHVKLEKVLGSIYVRNLNLPDQHGFYPVLVLPSGYERHLLEGHDTVQYLKSDDSIMLIKAGGRDEIIYYLIKHNKGESVSDIQKVSDSIFKEYESVVTAKYFFSAEEKSN
jgi:hypothetical protein